MVKIESKRKWRSPISRKIATELQAIQFWMQVTSQTQIASQKPAISCQSGADRQNYENYEVD
jgi:hypothetical protein